MRVGERPAGRPPIAGGPTDGAACGARGGWGPFLTPRPRLEEKEDSPGRRRRRGPGLGLLWSPRCRESSPRRLPPAAPVSGPSSAPAGLGRRLRSATARPAALRAEPRRPCSGRAAAPQQSPSPGPARSRALVAPSPPGGRLEPDPELPDASTLSTVLSLILGPTPPKTYFLKGPNAKEKMKMRKRILQAFRDPVIIVSPATPFGSVSWRVFFFFFRSNNKERGNA